MVRENLDNKKRFFSPLFFPPFSLSPSALSAEGEVWLEEPVFLCSFCYSVHYFNRKKM